MTFTYDAYKSLIALLQGNNYTITDYHNWASHEKCVILRHDIDYDIKKALEFANLENGLGVKSTYFVLVTSDFYNVLSSANANMLNKIAALGHEIGLHFDEVRYPGYTLDGLREKIIDESGLLEKAAGVKVSTVSMHRPSKMILDSDLQISGIVNSYNSTFFKSFKYLSDSRRRWREPVKEIIASNQFKKLHILTHAFWYNDKEADLHDSISLFVNNANRDRYITLSENITDLQSIMDPDEIK